MGFHPNGVDAITAVTYVASQPLALLARFEALYGRDRMALKRDALIIDTGCGVFRIITPRAAALYYGETPLPRSRDGCAHGIAIALATSRFDDLESLWRENGLSYRRSPAGSLLLEPRSCGNVILEFVPSGANPQH